MGESGLDSSGSGNLQLRSLVHAGINLRGYVNDGQEFLDHSREYQFLDSAPWKS